MSKSKRPRRRDIDEDRAFGDLTPWKNPAALYGFRLGVAGLVPILGMLLGPIAAVLGTIGIRRQRKDESVGGYSQSRAALILGLIETVCNAAGIALIARGMGWWS